MPLTPVADAAEQQTGGHLTPVAEDQPFQLRPGQREAHGWESFVGGLEGSSGGLLARGKLPDVVLDRQHSHWYERVLENVGQVVGDIPAMLPGALMARGSPKAAGALMMAVPAEIRAALTKSYESGDATSSADFLSRAGIVMKGLTDSEVLKATAKAAAVGAATVGAGQLARPFGVAAATAAEIGTMTVAPAALDARLPEPQDFVDAAIVVGGMKVAGRVASRIAQVYDKTGIEPAQVAADAKADPTLAEELKQEVAPGQDAPIPKAYEAAATAEAVRNGVPDSATDPEHAIKMESVLAKPIGDVPSSKTPNFLNFRWLDAPEQVKGYLARISEVFGQQIEALRGSQTWEQTRAKAEQLIHDWAKENGVNVAIPLDPAAFKELAAKTMASVAMTQRGAFDIQAAKDKILSEGATPENVSALSEAFEKLRMVIANDQGNAAEMGRAMNARKAMKQIRALSDQMLAMRERYGADPVTLSNMLDQLDTSAKVARFVKPFEEMNNWQKAQQIYRFALLTGATVFQVKGIGDVMALSERIARRYIAAGLPGSSLGEANAMLSSTFEGVRDALHAMVSTWKATNALRGPDNVSGYKPTFGVKEGNAPIEGSIADRANKLLAIPHRVIASETEFFRILNERGEMGRLAHKQAVADGFERGTTDYDARMTEILKAPSKEMIDAAKKAGDEGTFTSELGKWGKRLQDISQDDQGGFVVPFAKVPANLASWAVKDIPGLGFMMKDMQEDWKAGGEKRNMVIARQIVGGTVATLAVEGVLKGTLTGGSQWMTPQQRDAKRAAGWQEYSFKFPWSDTYHSFNRYQPLGTIAQLAADLTEIYQHSSEDEKADVMKMSGAVLGHAIISQAYFEGLHQFMQALTSTTEGARYFDGFVSSWVPSFLGQSAAAMDPQRRRVDSLMEAVQAKIPFWRERLLPQVNALTGEPLTEKRSLALSQATTPSKDSVLSEALRLGIGVGKAPKSIDVGGTMARAEGKIELTPEQQNLFLTTSGKIAHTILTRMVNSPRWETYTDRQQKKIYADVLTMARKEGGAASVSAAERRETSRAILDKVRGELDKVRTLH